jgi:hypothetical protein
LNAPLGRESLPAALAGGEASRDQTAVFETIEHVITLRGRPVVATPRGRIDSAVVMLHECFRMRAEWQEK